MKLIKGLLKEKKVNYDIKINFSDEEVENNFSILRNYFYKNPKLCKDFIYNEIISPEEKIGEYMLMHTEMKRKLLKDVRIIAFKHYATRGYLYLSDKKKIL